MLPNLEIRHEGMGWKVGEVIPRSLIKHIDAHLHIGSVVPTEKPITINGVLSADDLKKMDAGQTEPEQYALAVARAVEMQRELESRLEVITKLETELERVTQERDEWKTIAETFSENQHSSSVQAE